MKRPIPKRLLINYGTLKSNPKTDRGTVVSETEYDLKFVRVENNLSRNNQNIGEMNTSTAVLFWDVVNTEIKDGGSDVEYIPEKGDIFEDELTGESYTFREVQHVQDDTRVHHYEVELS